MPVNGKYVALAAVGISIGGAFLATPIKLIIQKTFEPTLAETAAKMNADPPALGTDVQFVRASYEPNIPALSVTYRFTNLSLERANRTSVSIYARDVAARMMCRHPGFRELFKGKAELWVYAVDRNDITIAMARRKPSESCVVSDAPRFDPDKPFTIIR